MNERVGKYLPGQAYPYHCVWYIYNGTAKVVVGNIGSGRDAKRIARELNKQGVAPSATWSFS